MCLRFEFDTTWLNVCVLKTLNFWLFIFLLFFMQKQINVPKKKKNNENERAGKAFYSCSNFLSISNLLIIWTLYARVLNLILNG